MPGNTYHSIAELDILFTPSTMLLTPTTVTAIVAILEVSLVSGRPTERIGKRCTGTIASLSDVSAAVQCATINIDAFTVPAGQTFDLECATGTTINLLGDVTFAFSNWAGPFFQIAGTSVTFNGNGHTFNGQGALYWDGEGTSGGVTKPKFMKVKNSGIFRDLKILNGPAQTFSIANTAPLTIDGITIDDSAGDAANSLSEGTAAARNTDGFDVSGSNLIIQNSIIKNQDSCLSINQGTNITFQNNQCSGGHGISIGSTLSDIVINNVNILNNTVTNSDFCFRINMDAAEVGSTISGITYTNNTGSTIHKCGVLIDGSYPSTIGTPATGGVLSNVQFPSKDTISVDSTAYRVEVNCGVGACTGTWDWSGLKVTGGLAGVINYGGIIGYTSG
ncbi:hypothetical protein FRB94_001548 [Tulasnella sp. JGI-2019a]|nr:hypothetical protein FRB93_012512 [Tulasnella sp. JGI-2019a]KAG9005463.1 hypothetical protein FRB94_001548 [Tulasnella sp. JGI-2019a]